jgi:hypothetical protein
MNDKITVPPIIKDNKRKPPFPEDIETLPCIDPLFTTTTDFDWPELSRLLGEANELDENDRETLVRLINEIVTWAITANSTPRLDLVGIRVVALAWIVNPALFDGASATTLAKKAGINVDRIHQATGAASRRFGIRSHAQSHAGNFKK